jgi:hypothetical protein
LPPHDDDLAIRYGTMSDRLALQKSARTTFLRRGYYGLSMFSLSGHSAQEIAAAVAGRTGVTDGKMRSARVGDLRAAGFDVADHTADGHMNLRLPGEPDEDVWRRIEEVMGPPERIKIPRQLGEVR